MARITPSALISEIRGKSADQIFSRNRYGAFVKAYASPVQPNTTKQLNAREWMQNVVDAWQVSPSDERPQWEQLAQSINFQSKRSPRSRLTAYNIYTRVNMLRQLIGLSMIATPGSILAPNPVSFTSATVTTEEVTVYVQSEYTSTAWRTLVYASEQKNPSRASLNGNELKYVGQASASSSFGSIDVSTAYFNAWGSLEGWEGQFVFLLVRQVNINTGQQLPPIWLRAEVFPV